MCKGPEKDIILASHFVHLSCMPLLWTSPGRTHWEFVSNLTHTIHWLAKSTFRDQNIHRSFTGMQALIGYPGRQTYVAPISTIKLLAIPISSDCLHYFMITIRCKSTIMSNSMSYPSRMIIGSEGTSPPSRVSPREPSARERESLRPITNYGTPASGAPVSRLLYRETA